MPMFNSCAARKTPNSGRIREFDFNLTGQIEKFSQAALIEKLLAERSVAKEDLSFDNTIPELQDDQTP